MKTNATEIRASFKKLLDDGLVHSRAELFAYAREVRPEKNYTEGMLTGALKTLTDSGTGYNCVSRALYQKANANNGNYVDDLVASYLGIFKHSLEKIEKDVKINPFKLMEISDEDKNKLKKVENCVEYIQSIISELEKTDK